MGCFVYPFVRPPLLGVTKTDVALGEAAQREPREHAVGGGDRSAVQQRDEQVRAGRVERALDRVERGVEREQRADDLDQRRRRRRSPCPTGTSERKAIGSETMNASSELARTSLAAPPIAAPKAAKPAPPATIASRISGERAPVDRDERGERRRASAA